MPATEARLDRPLGIAAGPGDTIWVVEANSGRVRWVDSAGIIHTGATGLAQPHGITFGPNESPFVADSSNYRVVAVLDAGRVTTVAGTFEVAGFAGDRGKAKRARLFLPSDVAVDDGGNLYIADNANQRIRKVDAVTDKIDTIAGDGSATFGGDGGPATDAQIQNPDAIEVDRAGTKLYIADTRNNRIRLVDLSTGIITTIGGSGGNSGPLVPGATGLETPLNHLNTLALDAAGNLYMVVNYTGLGNVIMQMSPTGTMTRVVGGGASTDPSVAPLDFALPNVNALDIDATGALLMASNDGLIYRFPGIGVASAP
ncbi:MAG: hypothetical protein ABIZ34_09125 [Candidatus Limnocylindrales bacterium]